MIELKEISQLDISDRMRLKLQTGEYKGEMRVDLRQYVKVKEEFIPTPKGINFNAEHIDKFIEMVEKLKD